MLPTFTQEEQALVDKWLANETKDLAKLNSSLAIAQAAYTETQTENGIYDKMKQSALDEQDALLVAKAAAIEAADPDFERTVEYLGGHPSNGGSDPTAWQISHVDIVTVVDYSHSDNWDNNPDILATEAKWTLFRTWQTDLYYGTLKRLDALDGAIDSISAEIPALEARNEELRDE